MTALLLVFLCIFVGQMEASTYKHFSEFVKKEHASLYCEALFTDLYDYFLKDLTPEETPFLLAIGGGPGSGKTTLRKQLQGNFKNIHIHDMDEVMVRLPGWQKDLELFGPKIAFENWWPKAREISEILVRFALESRYSILYDRSCGSEGSYFDLLSAKQKGYRITLIGLYVKKENAWERIMKREREEGRGMTQAIVEEYRARFSALWPYYLCLSDPFILYDSNETDLREIYSSNNEVQDLELYQKFLSEGESFKTFFAEKCSSYLKMGIL